MIQVVTEPALPPKPDARPFLQTVRLVDEGSTVATAYWHASGGEQGVVRIVDLHVEPPYRRRGVGGQLLDAVIAQATEYHKRRRLKFRQLWVGVEQKTQVVARAFLMERNFHHVGTIQEIYREEDLLIFKKSMD